MSNFTSFSELFYFTYISNQELLADPEWFSRIRIRQHLNPQHWQIVCNFNCKYFWGSGSCKKNDADPHPRNTPPIVYPCPRSSHRTPSTRSPAICNRPKFSAAQSPSIVKTPWRSRPNREGGARESERKRVRENQRVCFSYGINPTHITHTIHGDVRETLLISPCDSYLYIYIIIHIYASFLFLSFSAAHKFFGNFFLPVNPNYLCRSVVFSAEFFSFFLLVKQFFFIKCVICHVLFSSWIIITLMWWFCMLTVILVDTVLNDGTISHKKYT